MKAHWRTPAGLHTSPAQLPVEGRLPSFDGATGWLNSPPLTTADLQGKVSLVNLLDLHLHQLAPPAALPPRLGREIRRSQPGRDRGAHPRVRLRARPGQRLPRRAGHADRLSGRGRQRLRGLGRLRQSLLARPVLRRPAGPHPAPPLRRRRIPAVGNGHPAAAGRGGTTDHDHELVSVEARGAEAAADWATLRSPENYTGYARTENFASPGGILPGQPHHYTAPAELRLNHWALAGDWTIGGQAARLDTADGRIAVPVPGARPQPGHGTGRAGNADAVPRAPRRAAARP